MNLKSITVFSNPNETRGVVRAYYNDLRTAPRPDTLLYVMPEAVGELPKMRLQAMQWSAMTTDGSNPCSTGKGTDVYSGPIVSLGDLLPQFAANTGC